MAKPTSFNRGVLAGILLSLGAQALHWFITPDHIHASALREVGVALQATVGFGGAWWLYARQRVGASLHPFSRA